MIPRAREPAAFHGLRGGPCREDMRTDCALDGADRVCVCVCACACVRVCLVRPRLGVRSFCHLTWFIPPRLHVQLRLFPTRLSVLGAFESGYQSILNSLERGPFQVNARVTFSAPAEKTVRAFM